VPSGGVAPPHRVHVRDSAAAHVPDERTGLAMACKQTLKALQGRPKHNGNQKPQDLIDGIVFVDGTRTAA
jgi:hypothetical protein